MSHRDLVRRCVVQRVRPGFAVSGSSQAAAAAAATATSASGIATSSTAVSLQHHTATHIHLGRPSRSSSRCQACKAPQTKNDSVIRTAYGYAYRTATPQMNGRQRAGEEEQRRTTDDVVTLRAPPRPALACRAASFGAMIIPVRCFTCGKARYAAALRCIGFLLAILHSQAASDSVRAPYVSPGHWQQVGHVP